MTMFDVAVIGGGPAGSVAAAHLARGGMRTVLFEKLAKPEQKVCGEFISSEGLACLDGVGINYDRASYLPRLRLHGPSRHCEGELPAAGRALSRIVMDELLLQAAADAGAELRRGQTVKLLERREGAIDLGLEKARIVVCAAGKAEFRPVQTRVGRDSGMVGFKVHLRLAAAAAERLHLHTDLFVLEGGYGGLALVDDGLANFCFLLEKSALSRYQGSWEHFASALSAGCDALGDYLAGSEPAFWPMVAVAGVPYGFVRAQAIADDIYCVGDQLAVIPSFTGEGMSIAMMSGHRAAQSILAGTGAFDYQRKIAAAVAPSVRLGFYVHSLFKSPCASDLGVELVRRWPRLMQYIFRHTRLTVAAAR